MLSTDVQCNRLFHEGGFVNEQGFIRGKALIGHRSIPFAVSTC